MEWTSAKKPFLSIHLGLKYGNSGGPKKIVLTILFTTEGDSHGVLIFISLRSKRPVETSLIKTASAVESTVKGALLAIHKWLVGVC
jgi:hypothetical protein